MARIDPHAHQALTASAAGRDADPWLRAYLDARRTALHLDAAGIVALGVDGRARVRAWSGRGATRIDEVIGDPWAGGDLFPASALAALGLGGAAFTSCGARAVLVAARRASTAPHPLPPEPLIDALLELEQGRAATTALAVAAALSSTTTPVEVWRAVGVTLGERFHAGVPTSVAVPGSRRRLDAHSSGIADDAALAAIADMVSIALGREHGLEVLPAA